MLTRCPARQTEGSDRLLEGDGFRGDVGDASPVAALELGATDPGLQVKEETVDHTTLPGDWEAQHSVEEARDCEAADLAGLRKGDEGPVSLWVASGQLLVLVQRLQRVVPVLGL